jgi:hypothetical protein
MMRRVRERRRGSDKVWGGKEDTEGRDDERREKRAGENESKIKDELSRGHKRA